MGLEGHIRIQGEGYLLVAPGDSEKKIKTSTNEHYIGAPVRIHPFILC